MLLSHGQKAEDTSLSLSVQLDPAIDLEGTWWETEIYPDSHGSISALCLLGSSQLTQVPKLQIKDILRQ